MDKLLAKLSEQQAVLTQQNEALKSGEEDPIYPRILDHASSSNSLPLTPATDAFPSTTPTTRPASATIEDSRMSGDEVLRLKLQLAQAQNEISKLDQELAQTRTVKPELESNSLGYPRSTMTSSRESAWGTPEDAQSEASDPLSTTAFSRTRGIWGNSKGSFAHQTLQAPVAEPAPGNWFGNRSFNSGYPDAPVPYSIMDSYRGDRLTPDPEILRSSAGRRGNRYESRFNPPQPFGNGYGTGGYGGYNANVGQPEYVGNSMPGSPINVPQALNQMGLGMYPQYAPQPVGTPLSPHASEFTSKAAWKSEVRILSDSLDHLLTIHRLLPQKAKPIWPLPSLSTTVDCWTATSTATGNTSSTKSCATTTNKPQSSCSRSSRLAPLSRSMKLSKPSSLKHTL